MIKKWLSLVLLLAMMSAPAHAARISASGGGGSSTAPISSGTAFPGSPSAGDVFIVTDDSTVGACDSAAGSAQSLCRYNGSAWIKLGDGTAAGGALSSTDIDTSLELKTIVTDETGSGALVFATSPTLVTPALGTPSSGTLTNATGLPISTGVSGLGTGVATMLATPSSANVAAAVTDETGSGALVFGTSPTLTTPNIGTPSAGTLTNATGLPISTGVSGLGTGVATFLATPSSANLAAALTNETGTGAVVLGTAPTIDSPIISNKMNIPRVTAFPGTPSAGDTVTITDDSAAGACDSAAGSATTQCQYNGSAWVALGDGNSGSGAPTNATYIVQTANGTLSNEQALGALATGCVGNTTTTGVLATRTLTGTANQITVTNGDCSGTPTFSIPTNPTLPGTVSATAFTATGAASGIVDINGVTSGKIRITPADATAQTVTVTTAAQTSGATTLTIPDMAGTNDTFLFAAKAATLTNKTYDAEGTGNVITIPFEDYTSAAGCNNATAGPVWNLPATNPAVAACDSGSNVQSAYLGYNDTTDQATEFSFRLGTGFTGAIDFVIRYKMASATSGAIGWCVQLVRVPTGTTTDQAYPAQAAGNCVSVTVPGTAGQEGEATISGATCTSCAAGDMVYGRLSRDANGGAVTDSATGDGRLIGWTKRVRRAM